MASLASLRPPWRSPKAIHVIWRSQRNNFQFGHSVILRVFVCLK
jgi:hypothetical protein